MLPRFLLAATISVVFCLPCVGQEIPFGAIVESPFAAELDSIGELIELKVDDGQLGLFRRWDLKIDRENVDETAESLLEAEIQRQLNRGMPEKHARRMAEMKAEGGLFGGMETEKSAAYAASNFMRRLHSNLGGGGTSSGGGGGSKRWQFRGRDYTMAMRIEGEYMQMKLSDDSLSGFEFQLVESPQDGVFLFRYSTFDTIVNFVQRKEKACLSYATAEEAKVLCGANYDELLKNHSGPMNAYLIRLWEELGISDPVSLSTPEVVTASTEILRSIQEDEMMVFGLMESLGSDSLSTREKAASELRTGFYKWKYWVDSSAEKFEYDKISQEHLSKIRKGSPSTKAQDYANSLDLADAKTLVRVLELANDEQRPFVVQQLRSVTGQKLTDLADWREHLSIEN